MERISTRPTLYNDKILYFFIEFVFSHSDNCIECISIRCRICDVQTTQFRCIYVNHFEHLCVLYVSVVSLLMLQERHLGDINKQLRFKVLNYATNKSKTTCILV